jgi:RelA/SpoT family (p)ppGpp synthetase
MQALPAHFDQVRSPEAARALLLEHITSERLSRACDLAEKAHAGQVRKSGEPYVVHPFLVAVAVVCFGGDEAMATAAVLHDVVEDTSCTLGQVEADFGEDVAVLVDGLTKIDRIRQENLLPSDRVDEKLVQSALTFRKMLVASIKDVRVLVIKLCDRLHNLLTLNALPPAKQRRIAEETLVVYAPVAHRLGISRLKNSLEDHSFATIFPDDYNRIDHYIKSHEQSLRLGLNRFITEVKTLLEQDGFNPADLEIRSRIKHHYSIYAKMQRKGVSIDEVLDLMAMRILVRTPQACYRVLGLLHTHYKPLIARFKDYIALPKENGYQTLHTTLFHESGIYEVQIRTFDMHNTAEYGIAAHWQYKSGALSPKLEWLEAMQYSAETPLDFYELAKNDLYSEEVVVYSPKGKTYTLPRGGTALDFAFAVHTEVGLNATGALINGVQRPLLSELKTGEMIEIEVGQEPVLRCSWLETLKTSKAKNHMRHECNHRLREIDRLSALNILSFYTGEDRATMQQWLELNGYGESLHKLPGENHLLEEVLVRYHKARGRLFAKFAAKPRRYRLENLEVDSPKAVNEVVFDPCCHPKFGDAIVLFYYKRGKAIIHHKQCEKAYRKLLSGDPVLKASWVGDRVGLYRLVVNLENRKGALAQLVSFLSRQNINIATLSLGKAGLDLPSWCEVVAEFDLNRLKRVRERIEKRFSLVEFAPADDTYR